MIPLTYQDLRIFEEKASACENCKLFEVHGENCWFHWKNKKECSQRE